MMKNHILRPVFWALMAVVIVGCHSAQPAVHVDTVAPVGMSYAGGDGSSIEQAVIIHGATENTGVRAEYIWIAQRYPGYQTGQQSLRDSGGKQYDVLAFKTASGESKCVYFDITDFFGKF